MRFDEFVQKRGLAVFPVDQFAGLAMQVGLPPGWVPFDSAAGVRVWVCRNDPCIAEFCANAVLTMHRVEAALDPAEAFAMLADQQLQSVPGCHEVRRELAAATEGAGVVGVFGMQITHELGTIDSVSQSRIVTVGQETLIGQLTVTALHDSPVERAHIWLSVRSGATAPAASAGDRGAVPVTGMRDRR